MSELARAVLQFACETTIYACNHILEQLHARRPLHDEPLPPGATPEYWERRRTQTTCMTLAADTRREHTWFGKFGIEWTRDPDSDGWIGRHTLLAEPIAIPPEYATDPYGPFYRDSHPDYPEDVTAQYPDWLNGHRQ